MGSRKSRIYIGQQILGAPEGHNIKELYRAYTQEALADLENQGTQLSHPLFKEKSLLYKDSLDFKRQ